MYPLFTIIVWRGSNLSMHLIRLRTRVNLSSGPGYLCQGPGEDPDVALLINVPFPSIVVVFSVTHSFIFSVILCIAAFTVPAWPSSHSFTNSCLAGPAFTRSFTIPFSSNIFYAITTGAMHAAYLATVLALWSTTTTALPARTFARDISLSLDGNSVGYDAGTASVTALDSTIDPTSGFPATPSGDSDADSDSDESTDEATETDSQEATTTTPDKIRGVNLGGWLVLEKWMTPEVFQGAFADAKDQYTFDQIEGSQEALDKHWSTYITEQDIAKIASWGINTLRIPIGYWAYNHSDDTPYKTGADKYLKDALEWSRNNNLQVLIDLHGVPGSQNGFDNSGQAGQALWQKDNNMDAAVSALEQITSIYGTEEYSDIVWGIQLVNEPICWSDSIDPQKTHDWAKSTFQSLTSGQQVPYKIIMHDAFEGPKKWADLGKELNSNTASDPAFWIDTHLYQNQVDADSQLTQEQHIEKACKWSSTNLVPSETQVPVIVGEFSAQTIVCVNPDGSSIAGKQCSTEGCQCSVDDMTTWRQPMRDATTKLLEAELDTFEANAAGWFLWSYKAPGTWGLANLMEHGILGETVTDRKFPGQCQQYSSA
ncbi:glycoside hydrolase superfamily [Elsinoe ampelina]|uniref:glucan 1,3-beta-glucosidase n=1 Tax=Elsinoe ampelina TaxID=302913 RepID=A0A6A6G0T5_9PEZI|nr:glycoside hydrolase superfamily [Elsinoe ampelina]